MATIYLFFLGQRLLFYADPSGIAVLTLPFRLGLIRIVLRAAHRQATYHPH